MPYKIYTYEDPYKIDQADFWPEISELPHFCSARTLVNGLKDVLGDKIKGLICPLDALVRHEGVYKKWTDNINLEVQQYGRLTAEFKAMYNNEWISGNFLQALTQNQNHFLDAIRLFIELGIDPDAIDPKRGNKEQRIFVYLLKKLHDDYLFKFPSTPDAVTLKSIIVEMANEEVKECRGPQTEAARCERAVKVTQRQELNAIVVHGVHQFSPTQLKLIVDMEKMGITVIFLFNYQKKFSKIYSSWDEIYRLFDAEKHSDDNVMEAEIPENFNASNALAYALGNLCEEQCGVGSSKLQQLYKLYKGISYIEFANITEYAHFVSNHVESAMERYDHDRSVIEQAHEVWSNAGVLRLLDEQVYTANRDVHTLLKLYYPQFGKDRHFLSYPIGQFFSAIYKLWDYEKGEIKFDIAAIKECLSSNILNAGYGAILLRTFNNLEILFEHIQDFSSFETEIAGKYVSNYEQIANSKSADALYPLKQLSIYNKYKVTKSDIKALVSAIEEINAIAEFLFAQDNSHEDYISFGTHFRNLEEFLKQQDLELATEEERRLITALQLRLDKIKPEQTVFSGTFRDLQEGLHYYLKQKDDANENVDWIVKNYEQIDGDILQSKKQAEKGQKKVYHFACLSDRDMNMSVNAQLPWPLTDEFIRVAYSPIDLQFQVYYTALGERSNFLKYALFYGLCFNRGDVRLSYVKQYGDETTEPYALLSVLGLEPVGGIVEEVTDKLPYSIVISQERTKTVKYDRYQMMDMFLCPYRYFLDYVMEDAPVVQGEFLYQKYYENLLIEAAWKRIQKRSKNDATKYLGKIVIQESDKIRPYFSFWKETDIFDLRLRAINYLKFNIIDKSEGHQVKDYMETHMRMRKNFGMAAYYVDISDGEIKNPYSKFENLTSKKNSLTKVYSLHKLPVADRDSKQKVIAEELCEDVKEYINSKACTDKVAIPASWCDYCVHQNSCLKKFLTGE